MHEGSRRAILAAFLANLGIAIAKFVGFLITSSAGLLAEAAHSLADTGNQLLLLLGMRRSARARDPSIGCRRVNRPTGGIRGGITGMLASDDG